MLLSHNYARLEALLSDCLNQAGGGGSTRDGYSKIALKDDQVWRMLTEGLRGTLRKDEDSSGE